MKKLLYVIPFLFLIPTLNAQESQSEKSVKESGYVNLTSIAAIIGTPDDYSKTNTVVPSLSMINGYRFNENFSAGIGVGVDFFRYAIFPVFADFRYTLSCGSYRPFLALKGGYAFADSDKPLSDYSYPGYYYYDTMLYDMLPYSSSKEYKNSGGWMANPEIGVYIPLSAKLDLSLGLGYRFQELGTEVSFTDYEGKPLDRKSGITSTFNRLTISIGIALK